MDPELLDHHWPLPCRSAVDRTTWGSDRSSPWPQLPKRRRCPSSTPCPPCTCPVPTARRASSKDRRLSRGRAPQRSSAPPTVSPRHSLQSKPLRSATAAKSEFSREQCKLSRVHDPNQLLLNLILISPHLFLSGWYSDLRTSFCLPMRKEPWRNSAARTAWPPSTTKKMQLTTACPPPPKPHRKR